MMIGEWRIRKNVEGRGCGLMSGTVPVFFWRDWCKSQKTVRNLGLQVDILTRDLPNTKQEC